MTEEGVTIDKMSVNEMTLKWNDWRGCDYRQNVCEQNDM
jgi:hypothetical protein